MTPQDLVEQLLELPDVEAQKRFLEEHASLLDDQVADALKEQADQFLRSDVQRTLEMADLLFYMAELTSNPPYRHAGSGRVSPQDERAMARHELAGDIVAFTLAASTLLKQGGRFAVVYLAERLPELFAAMESARLQPKRLRMAHSRAGDNARLALVEGRKGAKPGLGVEPPLFIYAGPGREYSDEVLRLYQME